VIYNKDRFKHEENYVPHPEKKTLRIHHEKYTYTTSNGMVHLISINTTVNKQDKITAGPFVRLYVNEMEREDPTTVHHMISTFFPEVKVLLKKVAVGA
jgi:hypothetical protein